MFCDCCEEKFTIELKKKKDTVEELIKIYSVKMGVFWGQMACCGRQRKLNEMSSNFYFDETYFLASDFFCSIWYLQILAFTHTKFERLEALVERAA